MNMQLQKASNEVKHSAVKTYGDTSLAGDSHAILGDVSQDINIKGDVHVHLNAPHSIQPLQALPVANCTTRFLHICRQLQDAGKEIAQHVEDNSYYLYAEKRSDATGLRKTGSSQPKAEHKTPLRTWITVADDLRRATSVLRYEALEWKLSRSIRSSNIDPDTISTISDKASKLQDMLGPLLDDIRTNLLIARAAVTSEDLHAFKILDHISQKTRIVSPVIYSSPADALKASQQRVRSEEDESSARQNCLEYTPAITREEDLESVGQRLAALQRVNLKKRSIESATRSFLQSSQVVQANLSSMLDLQPSVLSWLISAINTPTAQPVQKESAGGPFKATASLSSSSANDVVEILSIHKPAQHGIQNVATMISRSNGTVESIGSSTISAESTSHFANTDLIRYDLRGTDSSQQQNGPVIQSTPDFVHKVTTALYFREEGERRIQVKEAHRKTFSWIFNENDNASESQFPDWLKNGSGIFFVNGKPGCGKSTLMKYVHQHPKLQFHLMEWCQSRQLLCASFFFWYAGKPIQKSFEGVLRSLLHQLLLKRPDLTPRIFPQLSHHALLSPDVEIKELAFPELQSALSLLSKDMPQDIAVFFMIDGVDEYNGDQYEFAKLLKEVSECPWMKILVSSRPTSTSFQIFNRYPSIKVQDLTVSDIRAYIDTELIDTDLMHDRESLECGLAKIIRETLVKKSSGVFLWIVIVVKKLLLGLDAFEDTSSLMQMIDELPPELDHLYALLFDQMNKREQYEGSLLLQLVLHAREVQQAPSTALQLMEAIKGYAKINLTATAIQYDQAQETVRVKMLDGKLRNRCFGLIEVIYNTGQSSNSEPHVDFLHRTVHDYLRQADVQQHLSTLYNLKPRDTNLNLLVSSLYMQKRRAFCPPDGMTAQACAKYYFSACLAYSNALADIEDKTFVPYLAQADHAYLERCRGTNDSRSMDLYEEAYGNLEEFEGRVALLLKDIRDNVDLDTFAAMQAAAFAPCVYFMAKVRTDRATQSILLYYVLLLLYRSRSQSPHAIMRYFNNLKALLLAGADPNFELPFGLHFIDQLTPWSAWLHLTGPHMHFKRMLPLPRHGVRASIPMHFEAAALLLRHGATRCMDNMTDFQRTCVHDLRKCAEELAAVARQQVIEVLDCEWTTDMSRDFLELLGKSVQGYSKKRRRSSDDDG